MSFNCPFALNNNDQSHYSAMVNTGIGRQGGPKEARLKRSALLSDTEEINTLFAVKVTNIPQTASHENLANAFQEFGSIGDIYIPKNLKNGYPKEFAIIRFREEKAAVEVLEKASNTKELQGRSLLLSPLAKQKSSFTMGTGYLGITNEPFDDGTRHKPRAACEQSISLDSCMSRSGYPWGSVRELKFLAPHSPPATLDMFTIKVTNLSPSTSPQALKDVFAQYGVVGDVTCPKPLLVTQQTQDANCGFAFVRFADKRDVDKAAADVNGGRVRVDGRTLGCAVLAPRVDGRTLGCAVLAPRHWPTEKTRRYY